MPEPTGEVLTLEKFNKILDDINSDEYQKQYNEAEERRAHVCAFLATAAEQGVITETEGYYLTSFIDNNGYLVISPEWHKKLSKVKE